MLAIQRPRFLDRPMDEAELRALSDMLRGWATLYHSPPNDPSLIEERSCRCDAIIYALPSTARQVIVRQIQQRLPHAQITPGDRADEICILGVAVSARENSDLRVWSEVLRCPALQDLCVRLRFTVNGFVVSSQLQPNSTTHFILAGVTRPDSASFLLKAIWSLSTDSTWEEVFRHVPWDYEERLLDALRVFTETRTSSANSIVNAARLAMAHFPVKGACLFLTRGQERAVNFLVRNKVEMPNDRKLSAFLRRLAIPLALAAPASAFAIFFWPKPYAIAALAIAAYFLFSAARILWHKTRSLIQRRSTMRKGLGRLYSAGVDFAPAPPIDDPTMRKYSAELQAAGATHLCDLSMKMADRTHDANRFFTLGGAVVSAGLLQNTRTNTFFPGMPILLLTTRFDNGHRHVTSNRASYRKPVPGVTARFLPEGELSQLIDLHQREVAKLLATGRKPLAPPSSPEQLIQLMKAEHEESRALRARDPYSWTDALYETFEIIPAAYRPTN